MKAATSTKATKAGKAKSRIFAYCRVSTTEQTTENQLLAILNQGYEVNANRVITETCSGSTLAAERKEFAALLDRLESGDQLVVLKLDRLGRDNIDVQKTIALLIERGIKPLVLDLPVHDLSSSEGKLMLQMFSAFAEFERNRIRERTCEGLERAKAEGKTLGRPKSNETKNKVAELQSKGFTQAKVAEYLNLSVRTVSRNWKAQ